MKKMSLALLKFSLKVLAGVVVLLLIAYFSLFAIMDTEWARSKVLSLAEHTLAKNTDYTVTIGEIKSLSPGEAAFSNVVVKQDGEIVASASKTSIMWSLTPLLLKKIAINKLNVDDLYIAGIPTPQETDSSSSGNTLPPTIDWPLLPFGMSVENIHISNLTTPLIPFPINIHGQAKYRSFDKCFSSNIIITSPEYNSSSLKIKTSGLFYTKQLKVTLKAVDKNGDILTHYYPDQHWPGIETTLTVTGSWSAWQKCLMDPTNKKPDSLNVNAKTTIYPHLQETALEQIIGPECHIETDGKFSSDRAWQMVTEGTTALGEFSGKISCSNTGNISKSEILFQCKDKTILQKITDFPIKGDFFSKIILTGKVTSPNAYMVITTDKLQINDNACRKVEITINLTPENESITGACIINGMINGVPLKASTDLKYLSPIFSFDKIKISALNTNIRGDLTLKNAILHGNLTMSSPQIASWSTFTNIDLNGKIAASISMQPTAKNAQGIDVHLHSPRITYDQLTASNVDLQATMQYHDGIFGGNIDVSTKETNYYDYNLASLSLTAQGKNNSWFFKFKNSSGSDIEGSMIGSVLIDPLEITINNINLSYQKQSITLDHPFTYSKHDDIILLTPLDLSIGDGHAFTQCNIKKNRKTLDCTLKAVPISIINDLHITTALNGDISGDIHFLKTTDELSGNMQIKINDLILTEPFLRDLPHTNIDLVATLSDNILDFQSTLAQEQTGSINIVASLPIKEDLSSPFIDIKAPSHASINGKIELKPVLEVCLNTEDCASGFLTTNLTLEGTFHDPNLTGTIQLANGYIENIYTGATLKDINIELTAANKEMTLNSLTASDPYGGTLSAFGKVDLEQHIPFQCQVDLKKLKVLALDIADTSLDGQVLFEGDTQKKLISGEVSTADTTIRIPKQLPPSVPKLNVTYIGDDKDQTHVTINDNKRPSTTYLNLKISSEGKTYVRGRGLNSEWKGSVHVTKNIDDPTIEGTLDLVQGQFNFAGKTFSLVKGTITFNGDPDEDSYLDIVATLDLDDLTAKAILKGPLSAPELTFASSPPMPTNEIVSRILFNTSTGQLSPLQAFQLAQTINNISGGYFGPDIIGSIREKLHLDQLEISNSPSDDDDETGNDQDNMGIQVGKNITDRIFVGFKKDLARDKYECAVETRLLKNVKARGSVDNNSEVGVQLRWFHDY